MKYLNQILVMMVAIVILSACNHNHPTEPLKLNNGEKWEVNLEMNPFIKKGNELLNTFIERNSTEYQELAKQLKSQNTKLIKSCTMKGESHDELHKWLHPHMELISDLQDARSPETSKSIIKNLHESYNTYNQYFN